MGREGSLEQRTKTFYNESTRRNISMRLAVFIAALCLCCTRLEAKPNFLSNALNKIHKSVKEVMGIKSEREDGKPWFCHDLDCPAFKETRKISVNDDLVIEERCYPETNWVQTSMEGSRQKLTYYSMFKKLFNYIQKGENVKKEKIEMTAPVLVSVTDVDKQTVNAEMGFFIPPADASTAPAPTRKDVKIGKIAPMCVYVLSYGGWQMNLDSKFWSKVNTLKDGLRKAGVDDFDESAGAMFAGYDSPWRLLNRHNEVMVLKKSNEEIRVENKSS